MRLSLRGLSCVLLAVTCVAAPSSGAVAQQFVIFDETWVHTADIPDSHYRVDATPETPPDLTNPVDYANGTVHLYMDVRTKPTDEPTKMQVCFEAAPTYGCTSQSPTYTTTGVVEWSTPITDFWSPGTPDWSMGSGRIAAILKDTENGKPSADNVGAERAARFTPTELHLILTWVAPGATYVPPMVAEVDGGTPEPDAGTPDAGPADTGTSTDTGTPADTGASTDTGAADDGGSDPGDVDGGCTVGGRGPSGAGWLVLAFAVFAGRRIRRSDWSSRRS